MKKNLFCIIVLGAFLLLFNSAMAADKTANDGKKCECQCCQKCDCGCASSKDCECCDKTKEGCCLKQDCCDKNCSCTKRKFLFFKKKCKCCC